MNESLAALCHAIVRRLPTVDPASKELRPYLDHMRRSVEAAVPRPLADKTPAHDYSRLLANALARVPQDPISQAMRKLPGPLPWYYHYETRPGEADLSDNIAFAELIGP